MQFKRVEITSWLNNYQVIRLNDTEKNVAIGFEDVSKSYRIYGNHKERLLALFSKRYRRALKTTKALKGINFAINKGENINLVGVNKSGKSTILNIISGQTLPSHGRVLINGKVDVFSPSMSGLDQNMTARQNIIARARMFGLSSNKIKKILPDIIDFSELKELFDIPIKQLIKRQKCRIIPSLLLNCSYEILLIDRWVVGTDMAFKAKCSQRLREWICDENITILFTSPRQVSAALGFSRTIELHAGEVVYDGDELEANLE